MGEKLSIILGENGKKTARLPDGEVFDLKPLTLADIAEAEEYFGCDLDGWEKALKKMRNIVFLLFLVFRNGSRDQNKVMTVTDFSKRFTVADLEPMTQVINEVMKISGLAGEAKNESAATA